MADIDGLDDAGAADGEKDLVADFLMREQDKLAGLEDDFGMFPSVSGGNGLNADRTECRPPKMTGAYLGCPYLSHHTQKSTQ